MSTGDIKIATPSGDFTGYLAKPASGKGPGVVVIQEIFGVNANIRSIADDYATQGYFALAPDLFWRIEPNIQLTDKTEAEWKRAFELLGKLDQDQAVKDIQSTIDTLRKMPGCTGKTGAVGYCLGGRLAYLTAARTTIDAAVGYYGVAIDKNLEEAKSIKVPLVLHVPTADKFVPPEAQAAMKSGLAPYSGITLYFYDGNDHAFARIGGEHYDKAAADLANGRTASFFKSQLS